MATLLTRALRSSSGIRADREQVRKASRGSITSFVLNAPPEYGQPRPLQGDVMGLISPERMREVVQKTPTPAAAMNAILDFSVGVPLKLRSVDPAKPINPARAAFLRSFMLSPNPGDTWIEFAESILRDVTTMGWGAIEIEPDADGMPANLWPLDAARLYIDFDEHGTILGYDMLDASGFPIHGKDGVHAWQPEEIILIRRNPQTNSRYPSSRIAQLFPAAVIENMMLAFIGARFTDSNVPFGVFDAGDITPEEQQAAIASWNSQARKNHRIVITGSRGGSKWYPFGYALKELEAKDLLNQVRGYQMAVMGVTMNELGESQDINKSNGYNLSFTFKKRAVEPLLNAWTATLTKRFIYDTLGWDDIEFSYDEIDSRDELIQAQIDEAYVKNGLASPNAVRNRRGDPSVPGGEEPLIFTQTGAIPLSMVQQFAAIQLQALQGVVEAEDEAAEGEDDGSADGGSKKAPISPPIIRAPRLPDSLTTPDGSGSTAPKVMYPKPSRQIGRGARGGKNPAGQKPRGLTQTARNAGVRH